MKKYLLILVGLVFAFPAHAAILGFLDGKYYNENGDLKYFCFADKNCFDIDGNLVDLNAVLGSQPQPSYTQASYIPYPDTPTPLVKNPNPQPAQSNQPVIQSNSPIVAGNSQPMLTLTSDPSFTATSVPANGTNVVLGKWILTNNENHEVVINNGSFIPNLVGSISNSEGFKNVGLYIDGGNIGGNIDALGSNSANFGGSILFKIPANTSRTLEIKGDTNIPVTISSLTPNLQINYNSSSLDPNLWNQTNRGEWIDGNFNKLIFISGNTLTVK